MMIKKRQWGFISLLIISVVILFFYVGIVNIPLRTQIYRSFFKGNWSIIADGDTIYASGYFGIRKYMIKDKSIVPVVENGSFIGKRITGHGMAINGKFIYLACRSYLPAPVKNDMSEYEGALIVLDKSNLKVLKQYDLPNKMNDIALMNNVLIITGVNCFEIYDVSVPELPQKTFEYISDSFKEFQGCGMWKSKDSIYVAISLFSQGIDIYNVTNPKSPYFRKNISLAEVVPDNHNLQTLDLLVSYPYVYAPIAPMSNVIGLDEDKRGILRLKVDNVDSLHYSTCFIPEWDYWKKKAGGDPHPKSITKHKGRIYIPAGEKGVAVFDCATQDTIKYEGILIVTPNENIIWPICTTTSGLMVSGDWTWNKVYIKEL